MIGPEEKLMAVGPCSMAESKAMASHMAHRDYPHRMKAV